MSCFYSLYVNRYEKTPKDSNMSVTNSEATVKCDLMKSKLNENLTYMKQISDTFPRRNGYFHLKMTSPLPELHLTVCFYLKYLP